MLTSHVQTQTDPQQPEQDRGAAPAPTAAGLAPEAIQFAHRMFDAARHGDPVLLQAVDAGLPANMTNDEGEPHLHHTCMHAPPVPETPC
jgi:hypothetical protein